MKRGIIIILLFCINTLLIYGQKTSPYKYVHKFQLEKPNEASFIHVDTISNDNKAFLISGVVTGAKKLPLSGSSIIFKRIDSPSKFSTTTNHNGQFEIVLNAGDYEVSISEVGHSSVNSSLKVTAQTNLKLTAVLANNTIMEWYNVNSKKELSNDELETIKKCVQQNPDKPAKCGKKDEFYITIEI